VTRGFGGTMTRALLAVFRGRWGMTTFVVWYKMVHIFLHYYNIMLNIMSNNS